jgi:hypothetical protein
MIDMEHASETMTTDTASDDWFNTTFARLTLNGHRGDYDPVTEQIGC